uniref:uncharacterized protein LOC122607866 n=1 Tax=Erigeron canadensis TaxID=72917 RepID=UPI001CB8B1BB|nr:uncharacterized protein LOC122607866 [Erigeron canadensis]
MMKKCDASFKKLDRKTVEKNRRNHMKYLCYKLHSMVPSLFFQPFKVFTQENQFDHSIAYIEQLQKRIKELKDRRDETSRLVNDGSKNEQGRCCNTEILGNNNNIPSRDDIIKLDTVEVKELDNGLQVILTSNSVWNYSFSKVMSIVEDAGAEVVKGGYATVGDKVVYTLHAEAKVQRIGIDITSIHEKLQQLINS